MPPQRQGDAWGVTTRPKILGQLLVEITDLDEEALVAALAQQRTTGLRIGETLVRLGRVTTGHVASALATQLALQYMPAPLVPTREALKAVRPELARQHRVVPLGVSHRTIQIAMADPLDLNAMDNLRFQTGRRIEATVAAVETVQEVLELDYPDDMEDLVAALPHELRVDGPSGPSDLERATRAAPVVRLVDSLIRAAVESGASDIHVEETGGDVRVRHRVDGILHQVGDLPATARRAMLSRIKVMAGMDISVKRRAQD
ncbi:MAG: ATPase, T2SS/T4P/T4SS family [Gemmatimonadota bacterium]|nr:ATPase, T2SS/T4P/T4SS family [Gemmatimonadota bacterium]